MGCALKNAFQEARVVFEEVDDILKQNLSRLIEDGSEKELGETANAQPALLAVSAAAFAVLKKEFGALLTEKVAFFAGHSVGEFCALQAAGCLSLAQGVSLLRLRGRAMQEACPNGAGGMVALLGVDGPQAQELARLAAQVTGKVCEVANDNAPGQVVLSGQRAAITWVAEHAQEKGVKKAVVLNVSGPFHSSLMHPAQEALAQALDPISFHAPCAPIVQNTTAQPTQDVDLLKKGAIEQITRCVRWRESVATILDRNISFFVECGSGNVLTGLIKRIAREKGVQNVEPIPFGTPQDLESMAKFFKDREAHCV